MLMAQKHRGLARMPIQEKRATPLLLSLLLPVVAVATLALFTVGAMMLAANDRAIVWAEGTPRQLAQMQREVSANPWFRHGRSESASPEHPLPAGCGDTARRFSFGSLGEFEAQAAREILELIASQSGARVCLTNVFIINELPDRASKTWIQQLAHTLLAASVLPCAMVVFAYVAMSRRLRLAPLLASGPIGTAASLARGVGIGFGASLLMALVHGLGADVANAAQATAAMTVANVGYPLSFTLVLAVPVIEEVAFRGWMIPLAERGIGTLPAACASSALYAAASLPADAWSAAGYVLLGMAYAAVYLRTRSVPACVAANVLVSATSFWLA